jgi:hypothetical protein
LQRYESAGKNLPLMMKDVKTYKNMLQEEGSGEVICHMIPEVQE